MPGATATRNPTLRRWQWFEFEQRQRHALAQQAPRWVPLPHQVPPEGDWDVWLLLGGRGSGKTRAMVEYTLGHLDQLGPKARVGVGAPTQADARDVCAEGESGLITVGGSAFTTYNRSLGEARHRAGGYVKFLGSEEPGRWNGPQWTLLWADELALWREESWEQAQFGLRLGSRPRAVASTTPKARQFVRALAGQTGVALTHASTYDNPHLSPVAVRRLREKYEQTRLGRQELQAEWLDESEHALWTRAQLEALGVAAAPDLVRVVVGVDPSGSTTGDEQGIVIVGKGVDGCAYVLADASCSLSPEGWARRVVTAYHQHAADRVVVEKNFGGDMVVSTLRTADPALPVKPVTASRGKVLRAEPIAALYEQGRVRHLPGLVGLEDQMVTWEPATYDGSPDRVDALVWALTELLLEPEEKSRKVVAW